jgi:hypothetical protein
MIAAVAAVVRAKRASAGPRTIAVFRLDPDSGKRGGQLRSNGPISARRASRRC